MNIRYLQSKSFSRPRLIKTSSAVKQSLRGEWKNVPLLFFKLQERIQQLLLIPYNWILLQNSFFFIFYTILLRFFFFRGIYCQLVFKLPALEEIAMKFIKYTFFRAKSIGYRIGIVLRHSIKRGSTKSLERVRKKLLERKKKMKLEMYIWLNTKILTFVFLREFNVYVKT